MLARLFSRMFIVFSLGGSRMTTRVDGASDECLPLTSKGGCPHCGFGLLSPAIPEDCFVLPAAVRFAEERKTTIEEP